MAALFFLPTVVAVDASGTPYAGAKLEFFVTGTSTQTDVYTDAALTTPHDNPVVADAAGVFAPIYIDPTVILKATLSQSDDTLIDTFDPYNAYGLSVQTAAEWQLDVTTFDINANVDISGTLTFGDADISGNVRLANTNDLSLSSTDHALQIGDTSSTNLSFDPNEIQCRNNGSAAALAINSEGGPVRFGNTTPLTEFRVDATTLDFNGTVSLPASASGGATLNIPHGTAPSSPVNGDIWTTSAGLYVRINGSTVGPLS